MTLAELLIEILDGDTRIVSVCKSSAYGYQANVGHKDGSFYCHMADTPEVALFEAIAHVLTRYDQKRKIEMSTTVTDFAKATELEVAKIRLEKAKEELAILFQDKYASSIIEFVESLLEYRDVKSRS